MGQLVELVRDYYEACNLGDAERIAQFFRTDATHYYQRLEPQHGATAIARHYAEAARELGGRWVVENGVEQDAQAVVEWTMSWRNPRTGEARVDRGTDWFLFRGGRIAEVRCYHHSSPRNRSGDLVGFDHAGRGHVTVQARRTR